MLEPGQIQQEVGLYPYWYYSLELAPEIFTPGQMHSNVALSRWLLGRTQVEGLRCLDIGTMESMVPILMGRRGAASVHAVDMLNFAGKIDLIQRALGADFHYHPEVRMEKLVDYLTGINETNFDVVVLSGVLYHVFDPMTVLGIARTMVRPGGVMIVETAAVAEQSYAMHYNDSGRIYFDWTSFWFITVPCLDSILRYYKLQAMDCVYLGPNTLGGKDICRIAVACRAVDDILPLGDDHWMKDAVNTFDYTGAIRWDLHSTARRAAAVDYDNSRVQLPLHGKTGSVDLWETLKSSRPMEPVQDQIRLRLGAIY
jgi:SAM-dependent methyltransferase